MKKTFGSLILSVVLALSMSGCVTGGSSVHPNLKDKTSSDFRKEIKIRKTTLTQIVETYGNPNVEELSGAGTGWVKYYLTGTDSALLVLGTDTLLDIGGEMLSSKVDSSYGKRAINSVGSNLKNGDKKMKVLHIDFKNNIVSDWKLYEE